MKLITSCCCRPPPYATRKAQYALRKAPISIWTDPIAVCSALGVVCSAPSAVCKAQSAACTASCAAKTSWSLWAGEAWTDWLSRPVCDGVIADPRSYLKISNLKLHWNLCDSTNSPLSLVVVVDHCSSSFQIKLLLLLYPFTLIIWELNNIKLIF